MPSEKNIAQLYTEHIHAFIKHLKRAKNLEEKEIHKLRVEIKNLRVLFGFLQALAEKKLPLKSLSKLLRPVFKKAGRIRTAQLNLKLTRPYRSATMVRFREHLQKEEKKASKSFLKHIKKFDADKLDVLQKKSLKAIKKLKPESMAGDSESYIRSIFAKIRTDIFDLNKDEILHEIRKHLKTIKNMGRLMQELNESAFINAEINKIERAYEQIGKWHDRLMFAEVFEHYVRKKEIAEVQEKALAFILSLKEKNEKSKLLIIKKLRADLIYS